MIRPLIIVALAAFLALCIVHSSAISAWHAVVPVSATAYQIQPLHPGDPETRLIVETVD